MKRNTSFLTIFLAVILFSCQNKNAYVIEGSFDSDKFDGKTAYLQKADSVNAQIPTIIDSVTIQNSKFTFKGSEGENITLGFVSVGKLMAPVEGSPQGTVILEPGTINLSFKENGDVILSGTPRNDQYFNLQQVMNNAAALYKEVSDAGGVEAVPLDSAGNDVMTRMDLLQEKITQASFEFAKANINNKAGQFIFFSTANGYSRDQLKEVVTESDSTFLNTPEMQVVQEMLNKVLPEVGMRFSDAELVDDKGSPASLSMYAGKGKVVLADFWASWCKPCIEEIPNLKKIYATYKGKGFEIIGVSEDDDRNAWLNAVKANGMSWVQLADDRKLAAEAYGLTLIPHTVLLDKEGTIVGINLKGKELEDKIAGMLK